MRRERKKLAHVARIQARGQLHIPTTHHADDDQSDIDEALAAVGLVAVAADGQPPAADWTYLWPCNVPTFNVWQRIQTQWRSSDGRRTGLDYAAVLAYLREHCRLRPARAAEVFTGIQSMESAALDEWDKRAHKG